MKKYFDILELPIGANKAQIKRAYYRLAKKHHPDVSGSKDAKEKFLLINEAYELLTNPDLKPKGRILTHPNKKQEYQAKRKAKVKASMSYDDFKNYRINVFRKDKVRLLKMLVSVFTFLMAIVVVVAMSNDPDSETYKEGLALMVFFVLMIPFGLMSVFVAVWFFKSTSDQKEFERWFN